MISARCEIEIVPEVGSHFEKTAKLAMRIARIKGVSRVKYKWNGDWVTIDSYSNPHSIWENYTNGLRKIN